MDIEGFSTGMQVLRIYTVEKDHLDGLPFYEWIAQKACMSGISGASIFRGIGGFCAKSPVQTVALHGMRINQPVVVEIIETPEAIEKFVHLIEDVVPSGIMTVQDVGIRYYGAKKKERKP